MATAFCLFLVSIYLFHVEKRFCLVSACKNKGIFLSGGQTDFLKDSVFVQYTV